jgi:peptidoglycan hydrolase-like protein with peptidoglycan-binding domain
VSDDGSRPGAAVTERAPGGARPGDVGARDLYRPARGRGRAVVVAIVVVVLAAAGGWVVLRDGLPGRGAETPAASPVDTDVATVERQDVVEREQVSGTLGFDGAYTVVGQGGQASDPAGLGGRAAGGGVVTWLPEPGAVVRRGQRLYEVDNRAVLLLYGSRPASRPFRLGMPDGPDVAQLERNLVAMGYDPDRAVTVDRRFTAATRAAVRRWQRARGETRTGTVELGRVAFLPRAVRVSERAVTVGSPVPAGQPILQATGTARVVAVDLDPGRATLVKPGDPVVVTMPDGATTPGRVSAVSRVAVTAGDGQEPGGDQGGGPQPPSIAVTVRLDRPPGDASTRLDQAPVLVAISTRRREGVLTVPITALLARHEGGYEVEVVEAGGRRRVPVEAGLYDEVTGRIEVDGAGVSEGLTVEVPVE